jgi:hypothetical protein
MPARCSLGLPCHKYFMPLYRRSFVGMTAGVLLLAGCSQDGTPAAGLCPSCAAFGGETGDFSGGSEPPAGTCPLYDLVPADGAVVLESGLRAAAAQQFVERDVALPAVWRKLYEPPHLEHQVGGFSEQTGLHAHIEVTGVSRIERSVVQYPWLGGAASEPACDGLVLSVRVTVESEDGAVVGRFEEGRADVYSETEAQIRAFADVKQFTGSLELTAAQDEHMVEQIEIYLSAQGARGRLTTALFYPMAEDGSTAADPFLELRAEADDSCPISAWPYEGAEAAARSADIMSGLTATSPYRGVYDHRVVGGPAVRPPSTEETEVSIDFGAPTSVCQGRGWSEFGQRSSEQAISFEVPGHLHTADARYDISVILGGGGTRMANGDINYVGARFTTDVLTSSQLQDRLGVDI